MARPRRPRRHRAYALTVPGVEDLAAEELRGAGAAVSEALTRFDRRDSIVLFEAEEPERTLRCGLLEDVFLVLFDLPVPRTRAAPKVLAGKLDAAAFEAAMLQHHALRPKRRGRSYKVVARVAGRHPFRRDELEEAFQRAVARLLPAWVASREAAALEVWVHIVGERAIAGMRVSGDELAQRSYKRAHLPASLKPTVARALVVLSEPRADDVFLDPMAGAGTILRERADTMRAGLLLGGDADAEALGAARINAARGTQLARWDATRLPLATASIDAVASNPPYGRQHGAPAGLERLYARSTREIARVLRPGGRCVLLTGEPALLQRVLAPKLQIRGRRRMLVRGLPVTAFVMVRTPDQ